MTRVDFYILEHHPDRGRELFVGRLLEKALAQGLRAHIHVEDETAARRLDDLLWVYRDGSFLPHVIGDGSEPETPVSIHHDLEPCCHDLLINLASNVPAFFSRFERVVEIVDSDPDTRALGRQRFRFYRDRGYPLETHRLEFGR